MKIDDKRLQDVYNLYQLDKAAQTEKSRDIKPSNKFSVEPQRVREGDRVELSKELRELERLKNEIRVEERRREERIQEVKRQIEEGTYNINAKRTAYGMLRETIIDKIVK